MSQVPLEAAQGIRLKEKEPKEEARLGRPTTLAVHRAVHGEGKARNEDLRMMRAPGAGGSPFPFGQVSWEVLAEPIGGELLRAVPGGG